MKLKQDKVMELAQKYCLGNYNRFARELNMDPAHVHKFLTKEIGGGKKMIGAVAKYCRERGLDFMEHVDM